MSPRLRVVVGDITSLAPDALVNAANPTLLGGGGVDAAIHAAAGPGLLEACRALPELRPGVRCPTGEARLTPGFGLRARHVIHTVGPVWRGGAADEDALLAHCYHACLALAREHGLRTLAFPCISCGVYGFPPERAADIAVAALLDPAAPADASITADGSITLVAYERRMGAILSAALARHAAG